ncbi:hypothetical protein CYMTET_10128 [Cymbomonas tetramitiformis]|uniref:Uncharacterized protein n=1 Tax=Cymbomonas tetramitiformis TaxID=36881 RepID=A0AAE0GQ63_9CHLO|nr:hypothetical protein CYMTET_10128 [Cymbomonas tetramitiformis]
MVRGSLTPTLTAATSSAPIAHPLNLLLGLHPSPSPPLPPAPSPPPSPPPPAAVYGIDFDGTDDYLLLPTVSNIRTVAIWLFLSSAQPTSQHYLVDARYGSAQHYLSNTLIGTAWSALHINAMPANITWASLPTDVWTYVVLDTGAAFSDNLNLMSRVNSGSSEAFNCAKGRISEVLYHPL